VKLVEREPESDTLTEFLEGRPDQASSVVARVEVVRAVRRAGSGPVAERRAADVLDRMALLELTRAVQQAAASLDPPTIRSLDAIHLASGASLGEQLEAFVTYDRRLAEGARSLGLQAVTPS
jgi:uncharacterized protein